MTELFASVAPVITVGGEVRGEVARDLEHLEIEEATDGMKRLVMQLIAEGPVPNADSEGQLYLDGRLLDFGSRLEVSIGPGSGARAVFDGAISGIEASFSIGGAPRVTVFAEDRLMTLRMTRRMRTYRNQTDADIARAIASDHGLSAQVSADGPTHAVVQQWNQSDLAFLRERGRLIQAELWIDRDVLHFATRANRGGTAVTLRHGADLLEVSLRADLSHQRTKVHVSGYDARTRDTVDEDATVSVVEEETVGGRTGAAVLERAFGARVSYRVRGAAMASEEAQSWARAEMLRRARSFVVVTGTTSGTPDMVVGSTVTLADVGAPFNGGGYYVTCVRHRYSAAEGFRTDFTAERATVNEGGAS